MYDSSLLSGSDAAYVALCSDDLAARLLKPEEISERIRPKSDPFSNFPRVLADRLNNRNQAANERLAGQADNKGKSETMFLPGFAIGAMPNHLNRSSLGAPIARGRRKFHCQTTMVSRSDCVLEYTGEQLDEADCDIIMALLFFAYPHPLGHYVPLNLSELLRKIHRGTGKTDYEWVKRRITALTQSTISLEARRSDGTIKYRLGWLSKMHVVDTFIYDNAEKTFKFKLDARWAEMFSNQEFGRIDWGKRMQIRRGQDMAKTLQRLLATSSDGVQRYQLAWLKKKMQYTSPMRKFRVALMAAYKELERVEVICNGCIEKSSKGEMQLTLRLPLRKPAIKRPR